MCQSRTPTLFGRVPKPSAARSPWFFKEEIFDEKSGTTHKEQQELNQHGCGFFRPWPIQRLASLNCTVWWRRWRGVKNAHSSLIYQHYSFLWCFGDRVGVKAQARYFYWCELKSLLGSSLPALAASPPKCTGTKLYVQLIVFECVLYVISWKPSFWSMFSSTPTKHYFPFQYYSCCVQFVCCNIAFIDRV